MTANSVSWPSWALLAGSLAVLLAIDLGFNRRRHELSASVMLGWAAAWIGVGFAFGVYVWVRIGGHAAQEYYATYAMEEGLSLDNIFVFHLIFRSLDIPAERRHTVLFWGILGAVVFRGLFIVLGASALERWEWLSYGFAAVLGFAAWHAWREDPARQKRSRLADWLTKHLPVASTTGRENARFFVKQDGRRQATLLLVALVAVELSDVMFAIDSVPAALSITHDRFIVYSSNVFAILGLRALYLWLAATIIRLRYLHYGLAGVLAFAALKMVTDEWLHIPPLAAIGVIILLIGGAVGASLTAGRREKS